MLTTRLEELRNEQSLETRQKLNALIRTRRHTQKQQDIETRELAEQQEKRQQAEQAIQAARLRKGLPGLLDRVTGKRKRTLELNAAEAKHAQVKAQNEQAILHAQYETAQKAIQTQTKAQRSNHTAIDHELKKDIQWLERPPELLADTDNLEQEESRKKRNRHYSRDGPRIER